MLRREALAILVGAAVALPLAARAQQRPLPVIGYLHPGSPEGPALSSAAAFQKGLSDVGFVASLARPGSNVTGFSNLIGDLMPKRLELISQLVPGAKVVAFLVNPNAP